jgi:hypothetical protein
MTQYCPGFIVSFQPPPRWVRRGTRTRSFTRPGRTTKTSRARRTRRVVRRSTSTTSADDPPGEPSSQPPRPAGGARNAERGAVNLERVAVAFIVGVASAWRWSS